LGLHAADWLGRLPRKKGEPIPANPEMQEELAVESPYFVPGTLPAESAVVIRKAMALNFCKWDPQVGDMATLAPFPLVLNEAHRKYLFQAAEQLTQELFAAEDEIAGNSRLLMQLSLPRKIRLLLSRSSPDQRAAAATRVMRFDFHFTTEGWKLSEVNSDVPGGFCESTAFTKLMASHFPRYKPAGEPAHVLTGKISKLPTLGQRIALVSAPGLMEDQQVVAYLASCLRRLGWETHLANPVQILWIAGRAHFLTRTAKTPVDVIYRFFQGEWLPLLPKSIEWDPYFYGSMTPIINSGVSMISESKRLPLVWDHLCCPMKTWRALLPETRSIQEVPWRRDDSWILKTAYSNGGETVSIRELLTAGQWNRVIWHARIWPDFWVAQKRFVAIPLETPMGLHFPCIGVYTIDGIASGIYARHAVRPWIDFSSMDVAVLSNREIA
jgi:glutathionylspermidine synthase